MRGQAAVPRGLGWGRSFGFTLGVLGIIALSVARVDVWLLFPLGASVAALMAVFHYFFPGSLFFSIALANLLGIYASIFVFFIETRFASVDVLARSIGFLLPPGAFLSGALWHRRTIRRIVAADRVRDDVQFVRVLSWLLPVVIIGALTFALPAAGLPPSIHDVAFFAAMAAISLVVILASRDVAVFLLNTGLLFEEFFARASRLVVPAFAFLTFYSLTVIVFASLYSAIDHISGTPHFRIGGVSRELTFSESLYFSLTTLSTVGYGDIAPTRNGVRILVGGEIVSGVLLLIFGVNEILGYSRDRDGRGHGLDARPPVALRRDRDSEGDTREDDGKPHNG